jgi:hypothetical protein
VDNEAFGGVGVVDGDRVVAAVGLDAQAGAGLEDADGGAGVAGEQDAALDTPGLDPSGRRRGGPLGEPVVAQERAFEDGDADGVEGVVVGAGGGVGGVEAVVVLEAVGAAVAVEEDGGAAGEVGVEVAAPDAEDVVAVAAGDGQEGRRRAT